MSGKGMPFKLAFKKSQKDDIEDDDDDNNHNHKDIPRRQQVSFLRLPHTGVSNQMPVGNLPNTNAPNHTPVANPHNLVSDGNANNVLAQQLLDAFEFDENFKAAREGDLGWLSLQIQSNRSLDLIDSAGFSMLYYAAKHGKVDAVVLLLQAGADPNQKLVQNYLAIHAAAEAQHGPEQDYVSIIRLLISHHANINAVPAGGEQGFDPMSPIQIAYSQQKPRIVDLLLKYQPAISQPEWEKYSTYVLQNNNSNNSNNNNNSNNSNNNNININSNDNYDQPNSQNSHGSLLDKSPIYQPSKSAKSLPKTSDNQPPANKKDEVKEPEGVRTRSFYKRMKNPVSLQD